MKTKVNKVSISGYNPKTELKTNSYSASYFHENSATKNTVADVIKNKSIIISNEIGKF
ncbi:MAG: hypothetical protein LBG45_11755 [Dysgonamonadaceae bacterium]|jgi:hypothetical protein|nr:hypothetical protein [Dysgonamonadaceae bacterium]